MFYGCTSLEEASYLPAKKLCVGCYEGLFDNCINLKHIKVGFEDWGDGSATAGWTAGVHSEGLFECPDGLEVRYGDDYIPAGWSVNGAAQAATISDSLRKPLAPKTQGIYDRFVKYGMISL